LFVVADIISVYYCIHYISSLKSVAGFTATQYPISSNIISVNYVYIKKGRAVPRHYKYLPVFINKRGLA
ncbi:MAG: hypothetical protein K6F90_06585, partial [Lachnospiraceae bacterium]|nr:hypothetical protein [Lachnospiraceae bacterium]